MADGIYRGSRRRRDRHTPPSIKTIALVGPGAIGTTVAALLHRSGKPVLLCGHTPRESGRGIELRADGTDPIVVPELLDGIARNGGPALAAEQACR
jgi:2-polyprenyl-6-methoxyphenol hydroxylase-like FAD-dependent oxidoreductase